MWIGNLEDWEARSMLWMHLKLDPKKFNKSSSQFNNWHTIMVYSSSWKKIIIKKCDLSISLLTDVIIAVVPLTTPFAVLTFDVNITNAITTTLVNFDQILCHSTISIHCELWLNLYQLSKVFPLLGQFCFKHNVIVQGDIFLMRALKCHDCIYIVWSTSLAMKHTLSVSSISAFVDDLHRIMLRKL